jgi:hypothetical protein
MRRAQWIGIALIIAVIATGELLSHFGKIMFKEPFWLDVAILVGIPAVLAIILLPQKPTPQNIDPQSISEADNQQRKTGPAQWGVVALVVAFTAGAFLYRWLMHVHLGHSAAMFLGVPAVLAILLALSPRAKTVTGGIVKGITLALLIVAPLLGEGYLCIMFAAPLFYLIGIIVGRIVDWERGRRGVTLSCVALVLLPMCLEGIVPALTLSRRQTVEATRIVAASGEGVEKALAQSLDVQTALPAALRIGFPRPLEAHGSGLTAGATRTIHFAGAEGDPPGDLVMRVAARRPGYVHFETVSDASKLTQWVRWDSSEVEWKEIDAAHTAVT